MATPPDAPQRTWRAACPSCGAPVEFRSAASPMAVCSYCRSTLLRDGEVLRRIGQQAQLFDDHSPLQIGSTGRWQGAAFTLVGRLQMRYAGGVWNEWHIVFDGEVGGSSGGSGGSSASGDSASGPRSAWLSEDNANHVISFDQPVGSLPPGGLPEPAKLRAGQPVQVDGRFWNVASVTAVRVNAAEGELPLRPPLDRAWVVADLRNPQGEVGTLDGATQPPRWSVGRAVALADLQLAGLKSESTQTIKGQTCACPSCGAALAPRLESTQSIVCDQCKAVVDVSKGLGADLAFYRQDNGLEPLLPLGRVGHIRLGTPQTAAWQVVGYVERCEVTPGEDEQELWREYLLYHRTHGFAFIVDANDGWSWTRPITGVPSGVGGRTIEYAGDSYRKLYDYEGQITYVLGEFYWHLARGQRTSNSDFVGTGQARRKRLNRELTRADGGARPASGPGAVADEGEVVWSAGETLEADEVMRAFRIEPGQARLFARDAGPTTFGPMQWVRMGLWLTLAVTLLALLVRCDDDCADVRRAFGEASNEYRDCRSGRGGWHLGGGSHGGSYGGYSSGGWHK